MYLIQLPTEESFQFTLQTSQNEVSFLLSLLIIRVGERFGNEINYSFADVEIPWLKADVDYLGFEFFLFT